MIHINTIIDGRYKIIREIGRGGTSCVYLAENIRLKNFWAIKEVYKNSEGGFRAGTPIPIAETRILTKLKHSGLPTIIDIINTPQAYLIVMEYIEGISLEKLLEQQGAQPQAKVIEWGKQLCNVLDYLHSCNPPIIYRDMKPANIMLRPNGLLVLIDFGLAREFKRTDRHDTTNLGTYGYAAPEQYGGRGQTDARTDIYCLGVTLYHLVTGKDPCLPPYGIQPIRSINAVLDSKLERIIIKATQFEQNNRYKSVLEMKKDIECIYSSAQQLYELDEEEQERKKSSWPYVVIPIIFLVLFASIAFALVNGDKKAPTVSEKPGLIETIRNYFQNKTNYGEHWIQQEVYISYEDERKEFTFVPDYSGYYHFYSVADEMVLPVGWIYDEENNTLASSNTDGSYTGFDLFCWLEAGETYYLQTTLYGMDDYFATTGYFMVYVEEDYL